MPAPKAPTPAVKRIPKKASATDASRPACELIDQRISDLGDWRGQVLAELRDVIRNAAPGIAEEWKWNTPVWSCNGIVCTGETYQKAVKLTFAKGAALPDPAGLFNSSLDGKVRRAIDVTEGARIDVQALTVLVRAAAAFNGPPPRDASRILR